MYLDLNDILRAPGTATQKPINLTTTALDDIEVVGPVQGWVRAANARQNIVVTGHVATSVKWQCARCLRDFEKPLELDLEAVAPLNFFLARLNGNVEEENIPENELTDDELAALFDAHTLDVLEMIRQAVVLQTPIAPLCSPDCPGLPEAASYHGESDPRWEALMHWNNKGAASADSADAEPTDSSEADSDGTPQN